MKASHIEGVRMKYTGTLAKPIPRKRMELLVDDATFQAEAHRTIEAMFAKLPDLFKAHGVAEFNYLGLVVAMAKEHVPGFKLVNPAGRPTTWGDYDKAQFRLSVDDMREANPGMPTTQAISRVYRFSSWEAKTQGMKGAALRKHYDAADLRWVQVARDAKAYESIIRGN